MKHNKLDVLLCTFLMVLAAPSVAPVISHSSPVLETSATRLECRWTPILNETIKYTWRDTNKNIIVNSVMEGAVSVIRFNRISRKDAGNYSCTVTTAGGSITRGPVQLLVYCESE